MPPRQRDKVEKQYMVKLNSETDLFYAAYAVIYDGDLTADYRFPGEFSKHPLVFMPSVADCRAVLLMQLATRPELR